MFEILQALIDPRVLTMVLAAIAAGATVITLAMPLLVRDTLSTRMKAVAFEREKIRQRDRDRLYVAPIEIKTHGCRCIGHEAANHHAGSGAQKQSAAARQRRFGSVPSSKTRSRSAVGMRTAIRLLCGQSIRRAWPSLRTIVGRVAWKSK